MLTQDLEEFIDYRKEISLWKATYRNGNVSRRELYAIAACIRHYEPHNLLEIGTFDGNTTLQMALNSPNEAIVHTLDLPIGELNTHNILDEEDKKYIVDALKIQKKYLDTQVSCKIKEYIGDSGQFDFQCFGPLDFAFIDGSHSYESVASDSRNVFKILKSQGIVIWHDFTSEWPGVYQYLSELAHYYPLVHIHGTSLVIYKSF